MTTNPLGQRAGHTLSIIIPVFNEKFTVEQLIDEVLQANLPEKMDREIILVDDCSTDGTREVLKELAANHPELRLLFHHANQGKGAAIRTAIPHATGDFCVFQDADLEYDPNEYTKLLRPLLNGDADVVYGSRFLASDYKRALLFWHSVGNHILTTLSNALTNLNLTDMETCYKMARTEILKSIPIRSNRFGIEPELTAKFAKRGCRFYEVPISYRGRSYDEGKKITWKDGVTALFAILFFKIVDDLYDGRHGHAIRHSLSSAHRFDRWLADVFRPWVGDDVLEIGAGMGNLARKLLPRRAYVASDMDPLNLAYLRNLFDGNRRVEVAEINVGEEEDFKGLENRFDTVVCVHTIAQADKDVTAMANILRALRSGGRVCLLVPGGPSLYGTLDEALGHRRRYTLAELGGKLEQAGFAVERTVTFNKLMVPAWWFNGKILKKNAIDRVQLKLYDRLVWLRRRIDRILPWNGVSIMAVARKP